MNLKRFYLFIMILMLPVMLFAQKPKVAVLDAVVRSGVKQNVVIPITENIIEELVRSGKYTVLDRAHITKVMEEKKFQVSGIVKSEDIKQLGNYLGADLIVVIDISLVEDIYFVSAKMIDVESGEIMIQASDKSRGDISIIFDIAENVGVKLAGGKVAITTKDQNLVTKVTGTIEKLDYTFNDKGEILFNVYNIMVSGMMDKEIHTEFLIMQDKDVMPKSKWVDKANKVIYDPVYYDGLAWSFPYPIEEIRQFGDPSRSYWGVFYIIDTAKDSIIISQEIEFFLPAESTPGPTPGPTAGPTLEPIPKQPAKYNSRMAVSYVFSGYFGELYDALDSALLADDTLVPTVVDLHILQAVESIYLSALLSLNIMDLANPDYETVNIFMGYNVQIGGGLMYPIFPGFQGYYGARFGYFEITVLTDDYTGFSITLETGLDLIIGSLSFDMRAQYEALIFETEDVLESTGLAVGVGLAY